MYPTALKVCVSGCMHMRERKIKRGIEKEEREEKTERKIRRM